MQLFWEERESYHSHFSDGQTKVLWKLSSCARVGRVSGELEIGQKGRGSVDRGDKAITRGN